MRVLWNVGLVALLAVCAAPAFAQGGPNPGVRSEVAAMPPTEDGDPAPATALQIAHPKAEKRPAALIPLYASLGIFNALDVHSTLTGLSNGTTREANPVMKPFVRNEGAFIALKSAVTATSILLTERTRKKHPRRAVVLMIVSNAAMAAVVANNYRIQHR